MKQIIKAFAYIAVVLFSGCAEEDYFLTHYPLEKEEGVAEKPNDENNGNNGENDNGDEGEKEEDYTYTDNSIEIDGYRYVDFGLYSGTLWASIILERIVRKNLVIILRGAKQNPNLPIVQVMGCIIICLNLSLQIEELLIHWKCLIINMMLQE